MSVLYHPIKENIVTNSLNRLSMKSVAYVDESKKELMTDVHRLTRLGVYLTNLDSGGIIM